MQNPFTLPLFEKYVIDNRVLILIKKIESYKF